MAQEMQIIAAGAPVPALEQEQRRMVPARPLDGRQLSLIHETLAKDTNEEEFNLFIEMCRHRGLDPILRQAYVIVYNKNDPARRSMSIVVGIDGQRVIAQRCGNYRPADTPTEFITDEKLKGPTNPEGLVLARVRLWLASHGAWHGVIGEARWTEFAPIKMEAERYEYEETGEVWADSGKPKKRRRPVGDLKPVLDDSGQWTKMPYLMLGKCATMQALRAGWPDEFGGLYAEEEMDRARVADRNASEVIEQQAEQDRLSRVRAGKRIAFTFGDRWGIEWVDLGKIADRIIEWLGEKGRTAEDISAFMSSNRDGLREWWALSKGEALEIRKRLETAEAELEAKATAEPGARDKPAKRKGEPPEPASAEEGAEKSRLV